MATQTKADKMIHPDDTAAVAAVDMLEYKHPAEEIIHNLTFEALLDEELSARGAVKFQPYSAACKQAYKATKSSGLRPLGEIWLHVIHCTQSNGRALGVARYFSGNVAQGSTQYVNDDNECYRCLRDEQIPWGAPGANYHGLHYEQVGFVSWSKFLWSRKHRRTVCRTAWKVARDCKRYGNPPRWLKESALRAGKHGITDHATCTRAFGGSHTDPGPNYPRALFMSLVRASYAVIKIRRIA